ncbi:MAG: hypothetical protein KatS3mg039_0326 [Candidatus Kapaibacterium sp.]|nr:MAG: hypothetical protein KatS3mg039_0326 [Candidatus Kapabacteria bacterium]
MVACSNWKEWLRAAREGKLIPLQECSTVARVQLVFVAALLAALLDVLASWMGWSNASLRAQHAAINQIVATRMGYQPPAPLHFSALGVLSSSLFVGTLATLMLWSIVGASVVSGVLRRRVPIGVIATAAVLPLPLTSALGVLSVVVQLVVGSARAIPSLGAFVDPSVADVRVFSIASKIELGSLVHALVMMRLLLLSERWSLVALGAAVAFVLRSVLITGAILLIASVSGLAAP